MKLAGNRRYPSERWWPNLTERKSKQRFSVTACNLTQARRQDIKGNLEMIPERPPGSRSGKDIEASTASGPRTYSPQRIVSNYRRGLCDLPKMQALGGHEGIRSSLIITRLHSDFRRATKKSREDNWQVIGSLKCEWSRNIPWERDPTHLPFCWVIYPCVEKCLFHFRSGDILQLLPHRGKSQHAVNHSRCFSLLGIKEIIGL